MKKFAKISGLLLVMFIVASCKKDEIRIEPLASLNVANAVIGGAVARINSNLRDSCLMMSYKLFTIKAGQNTLIKAFASSTPNSPYYSNSSVIDNGGIYSLFLTGLASSPEAVLVKDNIPEYPVAQVINVRLINLSPGSPPLSLTMGNSASVNVFSGVGYKQITEFKTLDFPLVLPTGGDTFQIRDSAGNLLVSYVLGSNAAVTPNNSRRRNVTLIVKGIPGRTGIDAFGAYMMPNY